MTEPERELPGGSPPDDAPVENAEQEAAQTAPEPDKLSSQRMRTIAAGLITLAILAVLAIAIFDGGSDDDGDSDPLQTVIDQGGTGGETQQVVDGPELGSLSVTGYLCPSTSSPDEACIETGPVQILDATLRLEDGTQMSLEGQPQQPDGSYAWLNIPIGDYVLLADGLLGPGGTSARDVIGATGQVEEGWTITNTDPNQPNILQILFVPVEDGEAAG